MHCHKLWIELKKQISQLYKKNIHLTVTSKLPTFESKKAIHSQIR